MTALVSAKAQAEPRDGNQLERDFGDLLETQFRRGEIAWYAFQRLTFKLGDDCRYSPDWNVVTASGLLIQYECKGTKVVKGKAKLYARDDAMVKIRSAASIFWWAKFVVVWRFKGVWQFDEVKAVT